jgi:hypothetical protein
MRIVASLIAGTVVALIAGTITTATLTNTGCGGCGYDDAPVSVSPSAPSCLHARAQSGYGCFAGAMLEGDNTCDQPLTISKAGTDLAADEVVAPGGSWNIGVTGNASTRPTTFAFDLGGTALTVTVAW